MRTLVNTDTIPNELKQRKQWVLWKYEMNKNGKMTKIPYNAKTHKKADSTDSYTWCDFNTTLSAYAIREEYSGIGFVMTGKEGIIGIDVDGRIEKDLIEMFDSYAELTPSGNGCRIFIKGNVDLYVKNVANYEVYNNQRFFTVTGNVLGSNLTIADREGKFKQWYEKLVDRKIISEKKNISTADLQQFPVEKLADEDDDLLLVKVFKQAKYGHLDAMRYAGMIPECDYTDGKPDTSRSRWHLIKTLYSFIQDRDKVFNLLLKSGLDKSKWFERVGNSTRIEVDYNRVLYKQFGI